MNGNEQHWDGYVQAWVRNALAAISDNRPTEMLEAFRTAFERGFIPDLLKALVASPIQACREVREHFAWFYAERGPKLREEADDDFLVLDALWRLMPLYFGRGLTLYRGACSIEETTGIYGFSWKTSREVAENFARGVATMHELGTVVLASDVPAEAIVCEMRGYGMLSEEEEMVVERRKLGRVTVVKRFPYTGLIKPFGAV